MIVLAVGLWQQVWAGNPAKFLRNLEPEEKDFVAKSAVNYSNLADVHRCECQPRGGEMPGEPVSFGGE